MISYLHGKVVLARWGLLIVDVNGIGYKVFVDPQIKIAENIIDSGKNIELYIHQHLREDSSDLYGFLTFQELELFERLISVNGVGPKAGLNIMGAAPTDRIIKAIISGIGKKVAAKIILDLKSKISADKSVSFIGQMDDSEDLISALESLGYKKAELQGLITQIPLEIKSTEEKVRWCLKNISKP